MSSLRNSIGQFATVRPAPPDLEFRCPDCPMCDKETGTDGDSFVCEGCEAHWSMDGRRGEWFDATETGCPAVIEWFNQPDLAPEHESIRHETDACILPDDHGGKHRAVDSWTTWDDDDPRVIRKAAQ
jgi:hypothetical protein